MFISPSAINSTSMTSLFLPPSRVSTFDGDVYRGNVTDLTPDQEYLMTLRACTRDDCASSVATLKIKTPSEAPDDVIAPEADVTPSNMTVKVGFGNIDIPGS